MTAISSIITEIRTELDDVDSTRWTDDTIILSLIKKSLRRAQLLCIKYGLEFGKSKSDLTIASGASTTALPVDFMRDIAIYYDNKKIPKKTIDEFERWASGDMWRINGSNAEFKEEVTEDTTVSIWYYPKIDFSAYTTASTMPWSDRLNDIIVEDVALRLKNIDEYSVENEAMFNKEMEAAILSVYQPLTATLQIPDGWNN